MGSLSNLYISQSYQSLAHLGTNAALVPGTMTQLQDGIGQSLNISFDGTNISSSGNIYAANITGSSINTGSFATTASFNAYTASNDSKVNQLINATSSYAISSSVAAVDAAQQLQINSLISATGSYVTSSVPLTSLNAYTQSNDAKWNTLGGQTGSYVTSAITASSLITASVNLNTITFTKGNGNTFSITVNTGSGTTTDLTSLNAFTASQETKNSTLASVTASLQGQLTNIGSQSGSWDNTSLNTFSASAITQLANLSTSQSIDNQKWINISTQSGSWGISSGSVPDGTVSSSAQITALGFVSSSVTASSLITASVNLNTITFTKGDATTFNITVNTGSGGSTTDISSLNAFTASQQLLNTTFATTGSNTFVGDQTINNGFALTASTFKAGTSAGLVVSSSAGLPVVRWGAGGGQQAEFFGQITAVGQISSSTIAGFGNATLYSQSVDTRLDSLEALTSSIVPLTSLNTFTQSILGTNAWTASIDTKFVTLGSLTGSYATTGSNVFIGNQTLQDAASNASTLVPTSGSFMLVAKSYTSASSHITGSPNLVNLIFKDNNNTGDTIVSGSNNIIGNPIAPTAGFKRYVSNGNIALYGALPQVSQSMAFAVSMNGNFLQTNANNITLRGPVSASAWTIAANFVPGTINIGTSAALNAEKLTNALSVTSNYVQGGLVVIGNQSALTGSTTTITQNNIAGTAALELSSSALTFSQNIVNDGGFTLRNQYYSSSVGLGTVNASRNNFGGLSQTVQVSGSLPTGTTNALNIIDNVMLGGSNTLYSDVANARTSGTTAYHSAKANLIAGAGLFVSASSLITDAASFGSAFVGRYNATDNKRSKTSDNVFVVGTGTGTATTKTGFLIDSGSNSYFEGTLSVSGSTSISGALNLTGSAYGNVVSMSITSNTASMNLAAGNYFELTASVTPLRIEVSNLRGGVTSTLSLSGSTASTITFGSNVLQPTGSAYTASVAGQTDILSFVAFNSSKVNVVSTINMV